MIYNKIELLKRNNRRNILKKEIVGITESSNVTLMETESTDGFKREVFSKLQTITNKFIINGSGYQENIEKSIAYLKEAYTNNQIFSGEGWMLFFTESGIEPVKLTSKDVFNNLDGLGVLTKFSSGYGDFIWVSEDLKSGACVERTEYYYEVSIWPY
ncbi:hypothetical protein PCCS19_16080 [Paenibacillus sp. CCS19]|uniref:YxiF family protein n=1 Tax=Paenibacillus sp. CCS19 TaxID=3158387 RepID=UPI00256B5897|nr:hypothetical protein [Paenibacillus cellulosilyticus]GMK38554.1 hypothetical protein PCCS19_16080 [Paenibacillus cellulosilyticus]